QPGEGPWSATPEVFQIGLAEFAAGLPSLAQERFGPVGLVIAYPSVADLLPVLARLGGNLAGVVHADEASAADMELAGPGAARLPPPPRPGGLRCRRPPAGGSPRPP